MPQHDDHDDLSALDFAGTPDDHDHPDALDFSVSDDGRGDSADDAFDQYTPVASPADDGSELAAVDAAADGGVEREGDEDEDLATVMVTNPPATVSVSALIGGATWKVDLSAKVTSMTETELAEEIVTLAGLAGQKGMAAQLTVLEEDASLAATMQEMGLGGKDVIRDFMVNGMHIPTAEQAVAAEAEVFATRYAAEK